VYGIISQFQPETKEEQGASTDKSGQDSLKKQEEDALADLLKELREKRAVTLIPKTGHPRWSRWCANKVRPLQSRDMPFSFRALDISLVELLPAVPGTSFRLTAEVQHLRDVASGAGQAGIFFGYSKKDTRRGIQHSFFKLGFNDKYDVAKAYPASKLKGNSMRLAGVLGYEKETERIVMHKWPTGLNVVFRPAVVTQPVPWRTISVEVQPRTARIAWQGKNTEGRVPLAQSEECTKPLDNLKTCAKMLIVTNQVPEKDKPRFDLSQGLGVYVMDGEAAFRNVRIELLGPSR
jgi:hypothetical protein